MDPNLSATFLDETNQSKIFLNSTAFNQDSSDQSNQENEKKEWKLSPIPLESNRLSVFHERHARNIASGSNSTPLKATNCNISQKDVSGYETKSTEGDESSKFAESSSIILSPPSRGDKMSSVSISANLSSFLAKESIHAFDSSLMHSLHKGIHFSPRFSIMQEGTSSSNNDGEMFQWSVEQLAILKPAQISEDEIAASYHSPVPEIEEKIQEALNEYWSTNVSCIPSPDGPRYVHLPHRDGRTTTIKYCEEGTVTTVQEATPSLCNKVRKKEAMKTAYATSSPKHRPKKNVRKMRNRTSQTEFTIPPSMDVDFRRILGEDCVYDVSSTDEKDEEVFDVSMCSNVSMRRRLFSANEEVNEEDANASMVSCDNLNESQRFNDSLSPVRRDETENVNQNENEDGNEEDMSMSNGTKSQIEINISILNDCMMQSMCQEEEEVEKENKENDENQEDQDGLVFHNDNMRHMNRNEFEALDESSSSNATPRHEDLDWTPRRIGAGNHAGTPHFRKFIFECSPIHPGKMITPKRNNKFNS